MHTTGHDPLERAISLAGGPAALARFITERFPETPITAQAICDWKRCPPKRAVQVEVATMDEAGRPRVTRSELRPDVFPPEERAAA